MTVLNDEDFIPGALTGIILHTIMWFTRIELAGFSCINECQSLLFFDMPISMFYFFLNDGLKILFSLILGGAAWALGGWMGIKVVRHSWKIFVKYK